MRDKIIEAVSQAWCAKENQHKPMDAILGTTIVDNVMSVISNDKLFTAGLERAAEIAIEKKYEYDTCGNNDTYGDGWQDAANAIAAAIRKEVK